MSTVLENVEFDPCDFARELLEFERLLESNAELAEAADILPFLKRRKHLVAYMGTFAPNIGPATEMCFEYEFFGDFRADVVLGSRVAKEFCVVEFEDGKLDSIFKKQPRRKNPEWSARFEHGFSQLTDWFYNLHDFRSSSSFAAAFGTGHVRFVGLLVMGRSSCLDEAKRNRMKWRSERVLVDSHQIGCVTYDDLSSQLRTRFELHRAASKIEP